MQKNGAGIHMGNSAYWDAANDNFVMARWPNEKRKDPNARLVIRQTCQKKSNYNIHISKFTLLTLF